MTLGISYHDPSDDPRDSDSTLYPWRFALSLFFCREIRIKFPLDPTGENGTFGGNTRLPYTQRKTYHFDRSGTPPHLSENDMVFTLNFPLVVSACGHAPTQCMNAFIRASSDIAVHTCVSIIVEIHLP